MTDKAIELLERFLQVYFETGMDEGRTADLAVEVTNFLTDVSEQSKKEKQMFIKLTKSIEGTKRPMRVNPDHLSLYERENDDETSPNYYKSYINVVGYGCITVDESIETIDKMIEAISCTLK